MHCLGNPRHTQSLIAYMILTGYFWKFQFKDALLARPISPLTYLLILLCTILAIPYMNLPYMAQP